MKTTKFLLCAMLIVPSVSFADFWSWTGLGGEPLATVVGAPELASEGGTANPDRRRVAGSAILLKTEGAVVDGSIPSLAPAPIQDPEKMNKIFDGNVQTQSIPEPPVEKQPIVNVK